MSEEKSKSYDFDADDPFGENPLESPAEGALDNGEEDLEFTDFDSAEETKSAESPTRAVKAKGDLLSLNGIIDLLKENYLYLVGGVVVLVILYYMYSMIFPSTPAPAAPVAQNQNTGFGLGTQPVNVPHTAAPQVAASATPVVSNQPPVMAFTQDDLKQMIAGFATVVDQQNAKLATQISAISAAQTALTQEESMLTTTQSKDLEQLNSQISTLNKAIDQSNQNMTNIAQTLLRTQSQLKLLLAEKAESRDQLILRAVVPGRAWLVDGAGRTISVAVGDEIKDYGKVESIDDKTATIIMSSGYVFN